MALIIDGVFLQQENRESDRLWRALIPLLARKLDMPIVLLDRGSRSEQITGVEVVPFPTYKPKFSPHDSALLQRICTHYGAHAFLSTHFTTPLQTPSVMIVRDMNSEKTTVDRQTREQQEKQTAISHARRHICTSRSTQADLLAIYAELQRSHTSVGYCGVDEQIFKPASAKAIAAFRAEHGLTRPYFLMFAETLCDGAHKNVVHPKALTATPDADYDVLCVNADAARPTKTVMPNGCRILNFALNGESLAIAYSDAAALVHLLPDQRWGSLICEAMSCGCPIIGIWSNTLVEIAQDAALTISGSSSDELIEAMRSVRAPSVRARLSAAGVQQAVRFRWEHLANALVTSIDEVRTEAHAGRYRDFYDMWTQLRAIQGEVDIVT